MLNMKAILAWKNELFFAHIVFNTCYKARFQRERNVVNFSLQDDTGQSHFSTPVYRVTYHYVQCFKAKFVVVAVSAFRDNNKHGHSAGPCLLSVVF